LTVFRPLITTGVKEFALHTVAVPRFRLLVDCKMKPVKFVGQFRTTFPVAEAIVSLGANERLNIVPLPDSPPLDAVPYRVLDDRINSHCGLAPSLELKSCRTAKLDPSVFRANNVP